MNAYDHTPQFDGLSDAPVYETVSVEDRFAGHSVVRHFDNRRLPLMVASVCCAIVAVVFLSGFTFMLFMKPANSASLLDAFKQEALAEYADNRAEVSLPLYVPELDARSSRVALSITGAKANGEEVVEEAFVSQDGKGLRLEPGSYVATVAAMPISSAGVVYSIPSTPMSIEVSDDFVSSVDSSVYLAFSALGALEVTDEQIETACEFIRRDPERMQYVDSLAEAVRARRAEAQTQQEAAVKAREDAEHYIAMNNEQQNKEAENNNTEKPQENTSEKQTEQRSDSTEETNTDTPTQNNTGEKQDGGNTPSEQGGSGSDSGGDAGGGDTGGSSGGDTGGGDAGGSDTGGGDAGGGDTGGSSGGDTGGGDAGGGDIGGSSGGEAGGSSGGETVATSGESAGSTAMSATSVEPAGA